jgi:outer membrane protein assembly factor BamA
VDVHEGALLGQHALAYTLLGHAAVTMNRRLRWFSPIGPLRFEWGFPLQPLPGEDPLIFEFSIGNQF